jgi:hypothetical protein
MEWQSEEYPPDGTWKTADTIKNRMAELYCGPRELSKGMMPSDTGALCSSMRAWGPEIVELPGTRAAVARWLCKRLVNVRPTRKLADRLGEMGWETVIRIGNNVRYERFVR